VVIEEVGLDGKQLQFPANHAAQAHAQELVANAKEMAIVPFTGQTKQTARQPQFIVDPAVLKQFGPTAGGVASRDQSRAIVPFSGQSVPDVKLAITPGSQGALHEIAAPQLQTAQLLQQHIELPAPVSVAQPRFQLPVAPVPRPIRQPDHVAPETSAASAAQPNVARTQKTATTALDAPESLTPIGKSGRKGLSKRKKVLFGGAVVGAVLSSVLPNVIR
jgi:hypothetical protein